MNVTNTLTKLLATAGLMGTLAPTPATSAATFKMVLSGDATARYKATCQLETDDGTRNLAMSGTPPIEEEFEGHTLTCRITQTAEAGRLHIELRSANGNVTRMSTSGAGSVINLSIQ